MTMVVFIMKQITTAQFNGVTYNIVVMDEASIATVPGIDMTVCSLYNHAYATHASFVDEREVRERHWHFKPGDVVLDVGAAFGSYAITAALQGAVVYAFEPNLFCRSILEENIAVNPEFPVHVVSLGLHEKSGWFDPDANIFSDDQINQGCLKVISLDEMESYGINERIDMIKLDVEGGELSVLRGAKKTIRKHLPRLLIEEHEFKSSGIGTECEKFLQGIGYGTPVRFPHHSVSHSFYESPRGDQRRC